MSIDADRTAQRAALLSNAARPDPKRVELMASHLVKHAPKDIAVLYNSATDPERREIEAASAFAGRVPVKIEGEGSSGSPLLDPEIVNDATLARAEVTNPAAAHRVREPVYRLDELRAMQVTITGVALSEI